MLGKGPSGDGALHKEMEGTSLGSPGKTSFEVGLIQKGLGAEDPVPSPRPSGFHADSRDCQKSLHPPESWGSCP